MTPLLSLFVPTVCVGCGREAPGELCVDCSNGLVTLEEWVARSGLESCTRCGGPEGSSCSCRDAGGFSYARSVVVFNETARALTLAIKRRGARATVSGVAALMSEIVPGPDLVTSVPPPRRAVVQGFDASELLAANVARRLRVPFRRLLVRAEDGPRQSDASRNERRTNARSRFVPARPVPGRAKVLIVDDVYTTGATAGSCSLRLLEAGAGDVGVLTWARTMSHSYQRDILGR